jgi:hypothetical protein
MEAFTLHAEPSQTEPDQACLLVVCFYTPDDDRFCCAVGLEVHVFFTVSANTLDCEVLIKVVHLRAALWEQSDKNYKTETLNYNCGKKWLLNVTLLVSKNVIF